MSIVVRAVALCAIALAAADAQQQPASNTDSTIRRSRDSLTFVSALRKAAPFGESARTRQQPAATVNRLVPDISAVGDFLADFSPKGSTQEDACRFCVREVEVALQAAVDPYFRGDIFLGVSDLEGIAIEQAFLTATALPWQLEARLGRFLMPFGKQTTTHRHDLHAIEFPYVIQRFFGPEGLKGTGVYASRVFSPLGFYQELQVTAVERIGEAAEDLTTPEPVNKDLDGLGYSARLRNYWDISEASNLEISASGMTGRIAQPFSSSSATANAVAARQSHFGGDVTFRWRPLQQGNYKSFILQGEFMRQINQRVDLIGYEGPDRDFNGLYVFSRYQLTQRLFLGGRYDRVEDPTASDAGATLQAGSGYLEWFPSEFSKMTAGYERFMPTGGAAVHRILLQAAFSIGPHKPHPF